MTIAVVAVGGFIGGCVAFHRDNKDAANIFFGAWLGACAILVLLAGNE
jgi:uncharacterized membrane protein